MAIFVYRQERLKPLFWMGQPEQPELPLMLEQQLAQRPIVGPELSLWPLEKEGALLVDTRGQAPLTSEEVYLIGLVAYQSTLGLQSARRFLDYQQSQAAVLMASKMAAVGQLAAGVAHELNTPLGAVQLQLELLEMRAQLDAAGQKALSVAFSSLEHSQKIISRLLYYSRDGASDRQPFDLNRVVEDTLQMLEHQLKIEKIELGKQLCADCTALINANEIQQVLTNLILNAKDSCQETGAAGRRILIRTARSGSERWLEVLDQGAGVPPEIVERIFEPFFTSKPVGKGVGLGLSVSLELVHQNGGKLTCMAGQSPWVTVFRLILPGA
jgi:signal transduction histidine kinase